MFALGFVKLLMFFSFWIYKSVTVYGINKDLLLEAPRLSFRLFFVRNRQAQE